MLINILVYSNIILNIMCIGFYGFLIHGNIKKSKLEKSKNSNLYHYKKK